MLDQLPNEIVCKIFSKTNYKTAKTCRLLSKRYDTLITEHGYHKDHIKRFAIRPTFFCRGEKSSVTMDIHINIKKKKTFNNFEELLAALPQFLKKIGKIEELRLIQIPMNDTLLDILNQQKFLRFIRQFEICNDCVMEANDEPKWFVFLEQLKNIHKCEVYDSDNPSGSIKIPCELKAETEE